MQRPQDAVQLGPGAQDYTQGTSKPHLMKLVASGAGIESRADSYRACALTYT